MSALNKKLTISIPILVVIVVSVIVTTALMNNRKPDIEPNLNPANNPESLAIALEVSMSDLNSNEKYAYLDNSLPTNTYSPKHIEAGDIMLFGDNCLVIFYKSFNTSYSYSKIGHINNLPELDDGSITVNLNAE